MAGVTWIYHDVVKVPKARLGEFWPMPFAELWDVAEREGLEKWPHTDETNCAADFALLRRGDEGKTFLLRQNW